MKHLSTITNHNEVFVNTKGYAWIQLKEMVDAGYDLAVKAMPNDDAKGIANYVSWY